VNNINCNSSARTTPGSSPGGPRIRAPYTMEKEILRKVSVTEISSDIPFPPPDVDF
jgi:hypothetical protein